MRRKSAADLPLENQKSVSVISPQSTPPFYQQQVSPAAYLLRPTPCETVPDASYTSNNGLWEAILYARARAEMVVRLDSFFLFEWVPRAPGLWWTPEGREARKRAREAVESVENGVVIYSPYGKASMLEGGVGNVRLRPVRIGERELYMMSASSSGACHEGFPIAVEPAIYHRFIDEIHARGAVACDIVGRLRFLPDPQPPLYAGVLGVPSLYLDAEAVKPPSHPMARSLAELQVTVAVSFRSEFEGQSRIYACYAYFEPGNRDSFEQCVGWMAHEYVGLRYRGKIISDFDEHISHFPDAPFSLRKVMSLQLKRGEMAEVLQDASLANDLYQYQSFIYNDYRQNTNIVNKLKISRSSNVTVAQGMGITQIVSQQLQQANQPVEVKALVEQLARQIEEASSQLPAVEAKQLVANVKRLTSDLANPDAEVGWFQGSLKKIKEVAETAGTVAAPILDTVGKLLLLFGGGG